MNTQRTVIIHLRPSDNHILPTHELSARRLRKLAPSVRNENRQPIEPVRTGRRTFHRPATASSAR